MVVPSSPRASRLAGTWNGSTMSAWLRLALTIAIASRIISASIAATSPPHSNRLMRISESCAATSSIWCASKRCAKLRSPLLASAKAMSIGSIVVTGACFMDSPPDAGARD